MILVRPRRLIGKAGSVLLRNLQQILHILARDLREQHAAQVRRRVQRKYARIAAAPNGGIDVRDRAVRIVGDDAIDEFKHEFAPRGAQHIARQIAPHNAVRER